MTIHDWHRLFGLAFLYVLLVLLIFFMAATPLLPDALFIELAPSSSAGRCEDCYTKRVITMRRGNDPITLDPPGANATLLFRVGRDVAYGDVRRVVSAAREAGYTRVTFVVRKREARDSADGGFSLDHVWR